jgi:hypothetical protein
MRKTTTIKTRKNVQKASPAEIRYAESLYCEKGITPEAIAEELGRDIKTVYAWRDKYMWSDPRALFDTGPTELRKILMKEATRIAKGEKRLDETGTEVKGIDADALSKVMKAYDYMCQKLSIEVIRDAFVEFDKFMAGIDPKVAYQFTKYHKMFLQEKVSQEV